MLLSVASQQIEDLILYFLLHTTALITMVFMNALSWMGIKEENVAFLNTQQGVQEAHFHFDDNLYNNCPDNVNLLGCYQTDKYFREIEDVIRNDLQFQDEILKPCEEMMSGFDTRPIMLHVRRGDPNLADKRGFKWAYTNLQDHHPLQPIEYYEKALGALP